MAPDKSASTETTRTNRNNVDTRDKSPSAPKIWVAMIGSISIPYEFLLTVGWLAERRKKGQIHGIVFCTWSDQFDKKPEIEGALKKLNIIIKKVPFPEFTTDKVGLGSFLIQEYQFYSCLKEIPNDALVIKCRTDLTLKWLMYNEKYFLSEDFINSYVDDPHIIHRIICNHNKPVFPPFRFYDRTFVGHKQDLERMIKLENKELSGLTVYSDERLWVMHSNYPIVQEFMFNVKSNCIAYFNGDRYDVKLPAVIRKFYALYFVILYKYYYHHNDRPTSNRIEDILLSSLVATNFIQKEFSWSDVKNAVEGRLAQTDMYVSFKKDIDLFQTTSIANTYHFTKEEWEEVADWGSKYLKIEPRVWLKMPSFHEERPIDCDIWSTLNIYNDGVDLKKELERIDTKNYQIKSKSDLDRVQMYVRFDSYSIYSMVSYLIENPEHYDDYLPTILKADLYIKDCVLILVSYVKTGKPTIAQMSKIMYVRQSCNGIEDIYADMLANAERIMGILKKTSASITRAEIGKFVMVIPVLKSHHLFDLSRATHERSEALFDLFIDECVENNNLDILSIVLMKASNMMSHQIECNIIEKTTLPDDLLIKCCEINPKKILDVYPLIDEDSMSNYKKMLMNLTDNPLSHYCLGLMYRDGKGAEKDLRHAAECFKLAADGKYLPAKTEYCDVLVKINTDDSLKTMVEYAESESSKGNPELRARLARAYHHGKGVRKDLRRAAELIRENHDKPQWSKWEYFDILWEINTPETDTEMINLAKPLAESGNKEMQFRLGRAYLKGRGVNKDINQAIKWMERAAEQNHAQAKKELQLMESQLEQ